MLMGIALLYPSYNPDLVKSHSNRVNLTFACPAVLVADSTLIVTFSLQPFSFAFRVFVCPVACLSRGIHAPCSSGAYFTGVKAIQPGRSLFNRGDNPFPSNEVLLKRSAPSAGKPGSKPPKIATLLWRHWTAPGMGESIDSILHFFHSV